MAKEKIRVRVKELRRVPASQLIPSPLNFRRHTDGQRSALNGILEEVGFAGAIVTRELDDGRYEIIDGHLRADEGGDEEIPILVTDLTDEEARKVLATYDAIGGMAEIDTDVLGSLLEEVEFEHDELDGVLADLLADNTLPTPPPNAGTDTEPGEPPEEPATRPGDLWVLGDHRLLCGDSTKAEDVGRLMGDQIAVLMNTDPPYGIDYVATAEQVRGKPVGRDIENDEADGQKLQAFLEQCIRTAVPHLSPHAAFYLWHPMLTQGTFFAAAAAADILIHRQIIWVKPSLIMGRGDYHWRHELCFYGWRRGNRPPFYGERNQDTIWEVGRETGSGHPTQKPIELFERPMLNHSKPGEIVYEPFAGSGAQVIAAENLGRRACCMEIDAGYCDVICRRWSDHTGCEPIRESDGATFGSLAK